MSKAIGPQKHLTLEERKIIEESLEKNWLFKDIAKFLDKDPSTISKEIRKHRERKEPGSLHYGFNKCAKRQTCHKKNICNPNCTKECRSCNLCNEKCPEFDEGLCKRLINPPYVCNGCELILTDNGTEFSNPLALEFNKEGIERTRIFYCNPKASYQKGVLRKIMNTYDMLFQKEIQWTSILSKILLR